VRGSASLAAAAVATLIRRWGLRRRAPCRSELRRLLLSKLDAGAPDYLAPPLKERVLGLASHARQLRVQQPHAARKAAKRIVNGR
jgi:hypothetical protein